ncbi:hypothetical protein Tco_0786762 [Tanacetum coccineum]
MHNKATRRKEVAYPLDSVVDCSKEEQKIQPNLRNFIQMALQLLRKKRLGKSSELHLISTCSKHLHRIRIVSQFLFRVISSANSIIAPSGEELELPPTTIEETRAFYELLYNNLDLEVKNGQLKSVYQEQCLTKKINALHLSSAKTITTLNEEIANLNNQLSKENSTVSYLQEEREKLKNDFKTRENELLDKLI